MRRSLKLLACMALAVCFLPRGGDAQLDSVPLAGTAMKLSTLIYWDAPNEQQVKIRLSGAQMTPMPGTMFDVKDLTIQKYSVTGKLVAVLKAPQCYYAPLDNVLSSPGHLEISLDGGKMLVRGEGFLWRQKEQMLIISNQVQTTIKMGKFNLGDWKM